VALLAAGIVGALTGRLGDPCCPAQRVWCSKKSNRTAPTRVVPVELGIVEAGFDGGPSGCPSGRLGRSSLWSAQACARATPEFRARRPRVSPVYRYFVVYARLSEGHC
jgi:hypothetical protein